MTSRVRRGIVLSSPAMHGPDVAALQKAVNERLEERGIRWLVLKVDGEAGPRTIHATRVAGWAVGLVGPPLSKLRQNRVSTRAQRVLRQRVKRTDAERRAARRRSARLRKLIEKRTEGAAAAVRLARSKVGITEAPSGSNRGPQISDWQREIIGYDGVPWCGCFQGWVLRQVGVKGINSRIAYTPYIVLDGKAKVNGMAGTVPFSAARPGDLIVFDFDGGGADHVGMVIERPNGSTIRTVEGNTSSDDGGSQSNGGGVFIRTRSASQVEAIVRPVY